MLKLVLTTFILLGLTFGVADASVVLERDRLYFEPGSSSVAMRLTGDARSTYLVQSWVSDEDGKEVSMFSVLPQLIVLKPRQTQLIKVLYQGQGLPEDRESLFWLNIQEIPTAAGDGSKNTLTTSLVQSIALVYRPKSLDNLHVEDAAIQLRTTIVEDTNEKIVLQLANPSPMHVSIAAIFTSISNGEKSAYDAVSEGTGFFAPYSEKTITIQKAKDINVTGSTERRLWFVIKNEAGFSEAFYGYIEGGKVTPIKLLDDIQPDKRNVPNNSPLPASESNGVNQQPAEPANIPAPSTVVPEVPPVAPQRSAPPLVPQIGLYKLDDLTVL